MSSFTKTVNVVGIAPAVQERSRDKVDRLLKAGLMLIEQNGYDRVRISDVAQEAGCSVGTFYERFGDKETFFNFLLATRVEEGVAGIEDLLAMERWEGIPTDLALSKIVDRMTQWFNLRKGIYCAALNQRSQGEINYRPFGQVSKAASAALARFLRARGDEFSLLDPDAAAAFAVQMINGALVLSALTESSGDLRSAEATDHTLSISDPEFTRQLSKAVCAYLGVPTSPETQS
ncbi:MAG: TetR/AcrR family transcriptional regulator [Pseudomonadota bacterium]